MLQSYMHHQFRTVYPIILLGGGPPPIGGHGTADASGHGRDDPNERTLLLPRLEGGSGDRGRVKRKPSAGRL